MNLRLVLIATVILCVPLTAGAAGNSSAWWTLGGAAIGGLGLGYLGHHLKDYTPRKCEEGDEDKDCRRWNDRKKRQQRNGKLIGATVGALGGAWVGNRMGRQHSAQQEMNRRQTPGTRSGRIVRPASHAPGHEVLRRGLDSIGNTCEERRYPSGAIQTWCGTRSGWTRVR